MSSYVLRNIDQTLIQDANKRAQLDSVSLQHAITLLLRAYSIGMIKLSDL